ncbi:exonuclease domain-containing protein [Gordonia phosphorivorans]|uniref:Exonuclease domain-containing protein n=1 Tax=Gordonia phosphorivorans TaxID=1056982 RepID=A0ABV6H5W4_9ACTN
MSDTSLIITPRKAFRPDSGRGVLASNYFVAIDLETTGFTSDVDRIVEIGAVKMAPDGTVHDRFSQIVNPGANVPLPARARRVHGISDQQIRSAPPLDAALDDLVEFVGKAGVVAQNISFENRMLSAAFRRRNTTIPAWQGLCTLATARAHLDAPSYKLADLLSMLGLPGVNSHRALDDAYACGALAAYLISTLNISALEPLTTGSVDDGAAAADLLRRELGATVIDSPRSSPRTARRTPTAPPLVQDPPVSYDSVLRDAFGGFAPTSEQRNAVDLYTAGGDLKLTAGAGSGKSTLLRALARLDARRLPNRKLLVLAFSAEVAREACGSYPDNTEAMTVHALAKRRLANTSYGPLLGKLNAELPTWSTTAAAILPRKVVVDLPDGPRLMSSYAVGRIALQTVEKFCNTIDETITAAHLPDIAGIGAGTLAHGQLADVVVPVAKRAWKDILNPDSFAVRFTHSSYMKLFADMRPTFGHSGDALLFDEAQDAAPLAMQIVGDQHHLQRVFVGDSGQAIFRFTGAVDSLRRLPADHTAALTQSFRFGESIAEAANVYLAKLGEKLRVRGNPAIDDVVDWGMRDVTAVLARTNAGALEEVIAAQQAGKSAALIGDTDRALKFCGVARQLKAGQEPSDPAFAAFSTWPQLLEFVEQQPGSSELATQTKLIEERGIDAIESALKSLTSPQRASFVASTAHSAKGLEFDRVKIADDFVIDEDHAGPHAPSPEDIVDEQRLAYVAVTRARHALNPGHLLEPKQLSAQRTAPPGMLL